MSESDTSTSRSGLLPVLPRDPEYVGPYRLLGRLGEGGMGIVYLARTAGGRSVAVKVLHPTLLRDTEARERFHREVNVATRVSDAFTAPVLDSGADSERVWMVTSFIPGLSLQQSVIDHGPLPDDTLRTLWYGLLQALRSVHEAGVVHRDVKPSNVLLTAQGPRLIDFGISMLTDTASTNITAPGHIVGTPSYMSPEHLEEQRVGPPADIFALGSVMVFAASGRTLFQGSGPMQVMYDVVHSKPELSGLPDDLLNVVHSCLHKDPAYRPRAGEMMAQFPADAMARAMSQMELGSWLPAPVARASLTRAQAALDLEEPFAASARSRIRPTVGGQSESAVGSSPLPLPTPPDLDGPTAPVPQDAVPASWLPVPLAEPEQLSLPLPAAEPAGDAPSAVPSAHPWLTGNDGDAEGTDPMVRPAIPILGADLPPTPRLGTRPGWRRLLGPR